MEQNTNIDFNLDEKISQDINEFQRNYFKNIKEYIKINLEWFKDNNIHKLNDADYFHIRRFLFTAIHNLLEIDKGIKSGVLEKLMDDVDNIYKYYDLIYQATKRSSLVMQKDFLSKYTMYQKIKKELDDNIIQKNLYEAQDKKSKEKIDELEALPSLDDEQEAMLKKARGQNADAVHNSAEAREIVATAYEKEKLLKSKISTFFDEIFIPKKNEVLRGLINIINLKSYCLDQALWYYAQNSKSIQRFFEISQIKGDFSLRTYIDYYLKNLDNANSKEIEILKKTMRDLDAV